MESIWKYEIISHNVKDAQGKKKKDTQKLNTKDTQKYEAQIERAGIQGPKYYFIEIICPMRVSDKQFFKEKYQYLKGKISFGFN